MGVILEYTKSHVFYAKCVLKKSQLMLAYIITTTRFDSVLIFRRNSGVSVNCRREILTCAIIVVGRVVAAIVADRWRCQRLLSRLVVSNSITCSQAINAVVSGKHRHTVGDVITVVAIFTFIMGISHFFFSVKNRKRNQKMKLRCKSRQEVI